MPLRLSATGLAGFPVHRVDYWVPMFLASNLPVVIADQKEVGYRSSATAPFMSLLAGRPKHVFALGAPLECCCSLWCSAPTVTNTTPPKASTSSSKPPPSRACLSQLLDADGFATDIIDRAISRVVTPGTVAGEWLEDPSLINHLVAVSPADTTDGSCATAWTDVNTGKIFVAESNQL